MNASEKILIAEDSLTQAMQLQYTLEQAGYIVQLAKDGKKALAMLTESAPDLVISDIIMPEMDGYQLCQSIKKDDHTQHIPVILLTALSDPHDVVKGMESGADSFIVKPYENKILFARIHDLLASRSLQRNKIEAEAEPVGIIFDQKKYLITAGRAQIIGLLLSSYEIAVLKNNDLIRTTVQLEKALHELEKKNEELVKLNQEKNEFLGIAAHDLKNPLTIIQGYAELLLYDFDAFAKPDILNMIQQIERDAKRMFTLIANLLDVNAIESGKTRMNPTAFDLRLSISMICEPYIGRANKKNIKLYLQMPENPHVVYADREATEQVIDNLISNAVKYTIPGKEVFVNVTCDETYSHVRLAIKDQGPGLTDVDKEKLFGRFARLSARPTGEENSTGLGLFIVKRLIEQMNGRVWCESEPGHGSIFSIELPRVEMS